MKIHCIHTGSTGNCYLVEYEKNKFFMLDCGIPTSMILSYFHKIKNSPSHVEFCLISHLHGDHLYDAKFINMFSIPTYFSNIKESNPAQKDIHKDLVFDIEKNNNRSFHPANNQKIEIYPFYLPHDGFNFGYKITLPNGKILVYMTDFGNVKTLEPFTDKIDYFVIECNYGIETIEKVDGLVQRRSKSDSGHCSNEDCFKYLSYYGPNLKNSNILLVHRSLDNLDPKVDYEIFKDLSCKSLTVANNSTIYNYSEK